MAYINVVNNAEELQEYAAITISKIVVVIMEALGRFNCKGLVIIVLKELEYGVRRINMWLIVLHSIDCVLDFGHPHK